MEQTERKQSGFSRRTRLAALVPATPEIRHLIARVFRSIIDLQAAIHRYIAEHNTEPKPFVWTTDPDRVVASINREKQALEQRTNFPGIAAP